MFEDDSKILRVPNRIDSGLASTYLSKFESVAS